MCLCKPGFKGKTCKFKSCINECNFNGICINGTCKCSSGYEGNIEFNINHLGPDCSIRKVINGVVSLDGLVICNSGWHGISCEQKLCPDFCNSVGLCINGKCFCSDGFMGEKCEIRTCPNSCSFNGICLPAGFCSCKAGFTGLDCSRKICPNNCNNNGKCLDNTCVCNNGILS